MLASARLVLAALVVSGCANHVRYLDSSSDRKSSELLEQQFTLRGPGSVVEDRVLRLELVRRQTLLWRTERSTLRSEEYTPYQVARELYEVPVGLPSIPLSIVFQALDILCFGKIPNEVTNGYTVWAFSASNPLLNAESASRVRKREVAVAKEQLPVEQKVENAPVGRFALAVSLDAGEPQTRVTDAEGRLELDLLDLLPPTLAWPPRRVSLEGRDPKTGESVIAQSFYFDRRLSERLRRAAPLIAVHGSPDAGIEELARAVYGLDQLGFRKEAAQIQDAIYARWEQSPQQLTEFRRALDRYYAAGAPFDAESVPAAIPTP